MASTNQNHHQSYMIDKKTTGNLVQVSAGELLGRTHEELVLLLIQLRRQSASLCKAMEKCHMEIEAQVLMTLINLFSLLFKNFHYFLFLIYIIA